MKKILRGKVIRIDDEYTIFIDLNEKHGVEEGMVFIVYEEGEEIFDTNGRSIGKIEYPKVNVKIINVSEKFSIAESDEWYYDVPYDDSYDDDYDPGDVYKKQKKIADFSEKNGSIKKDKGTEKKSYAEKIIEIKHTKYVKIGDLVKSKYPLKCDED